MNAEIFAALRQLEKERGIPVDYMVEKITQALVAAYKKDRDGYTDNVFVEVKDNDMHMYVQKEVVDDVITPATEITLDAARRISKTVQLGDLVNVDVQTKDFGRIAAQTAKQVIIQGIREAERLYGQCGGKLQERLGPPEAQKMLDSLGFAPDVTERVCFLIAHHHTLDGVDALDWRILLEADFLVNMIEEGMKAEAIQCGREKIFRTEMGLRLMERLTEKKCNS